MGVGKGAHDQGDGRAEAEVTLSATFRERRLALGTMDRPLKLATGAALGCAVGAAVVTALRDVGRDVVTLGVTEGVRTTLGTGLFVATLVFLIVGLAYVFTGAVFAHRVIAVVAVVGADLLVGYETGVLGIGGVRAVLPTWARWSTRGLLLAVVALAALILVVRRRRHGDDARDRRLRALTLCAYLMLFAGYLTVLALASPTVDGLSDFPGTVDLLMIDVALLAVPFLQIAAIDFGEWGAITGERMSGLARHRAPRWTTPAVLCVALVVAGAMRTHGSAAHVAATACEGTLLLGAAVGMLLLGGRALRLQELTWPKGASFAVLFVLTASSVWLAGPIAARATGALSVPETPEVSGSGTYTAAANVRVIHLAQHFTALVPAGWHVKATGPADVIAGAAAGSAVGAVAQAVPDGLGATAIATRAMHLAPVGRPSGYGGVQRLRVDAGPQLAEYIWLAAVAHERTRLLLVGRIRGPDPQPGTRMLDALARSARSATQPPATIPAVAGVETPEAARQANTDRLQTLGFALELLIGVAAVAAVATVGRDWPARVRVGAPLLAGVSLFSILYFCGAAGRVLVGANTHWPQLTENAVWMGLGILGLAGLVAAGRRPAAGWAQRTPAALLALIGGALALLLAGVLYGHAMTLSRVAVWAPIILLVAVAWDVTMSGESMTNHSTPLWPRASRVLLFLGYVVLVGATVVYYSGQRAAGSGRILGESYFEPEAVTQAALTRVALPVIVTLFLLRVFGTEEAPQFPVDGPGAPPTTDVVPADEAARRPAAHAG